MVRPAGILHYPSHGESVHRVGSRDRNNAVPIGHDDMLALPGNPKSSFLESAHGAEVIDSWQLGHCSHRDFHITEFLVLRQLLDDLEIFSNGRTHVLQGFIFGILLRPATGKPGTSHSISLVRIEDVHLSINLLTILHASATRSFMEPLRGLVSRKISSTKLSLAMSSVSRICASNAAASKVGLQSFSG